MSTRSAIRADGPPSVASAFAQVAHALLSSAEAHRRAQRAHRRAQAQCRDALRELVHAASRAGVTLTVDTDNGGAGDTHGRHEHEREC